MSIQEMVLDTLKETSRTFFIPICRLPPGLQEAVASAYLCMRAIDEIEDHAQLAKQTKMSQLYSISRLLQSQTEVETFTASAFSQAFAELRDTLPAVTLGLASWACYAPKSIAPRIWDATASMAARMAYWVSNDWKIRTEADLDHYTFSVAGAVGLLLCDLWAWFTGEQLDRSSALQFGRGLQAVNILRNRRDDLARGVDFFPDGWTQEQMHQYAHRQLSSAEAYAKTLATNAFGLFLTLPLTLAYATLDALLHGEEKLSREMVERLIQTSII